MAGSDRTVSIPRAFVTGLLVVAAAVAGGLISIWVQEWGIDHHGWFAEPCDDVRGLALCLAPGPRLEWIVAGVQIAVGLWLVIRFATSKWLGR